MRGTVNELPPLAQYRGRNEYVPQYGDYIVQSNWISTWHGVVTYYDEITDEIHIIFAGVPYLLFTMTDQEQKKETKIIKLSEIRTAANGKFAIQQHDAAQNAIIWYI